MSVHARNGKWQVKWRQGERQRSRTFPSRRDAQQFDRRLRESREAGEEMVWVSVHPETARMIAELVQHQRANPSRVAVALDHTATPESVIWEAVTELYLAKHPAPTFDNEDES
jgi:hypothetical protein